VYESVSRNDNDGASRTADPAARVLAVVGSGRAGLVTDVDGTISPIVARPQDAAVLPRAREALIGLRDRLVVVAVVTGRGVEDVRRMVGIDGLTYVGNHGLEWLRDGRSDLLPEARAWAPQVATALDQVRLDLPTRLSSGLLVENKGASASLHYRLAPDPEATRAALLASLARWVVPGGLRVEEGRRVINLLPPLTVNKGTAVNQLVREHELDGVVYFGDDVTDAHAFRALRGLREDRGLRTLAVGVVGPETPSSIRELADTSVADAPAVAELLTRVLEGLKSSATMGSERAPGTGSS
jgi:trehalose 6-phosphate phosphatase